MNKLCRGQCHGSVTAIWQNNSSFSTRAWDLPATGFSIALYKSPQSVTVLTLKGPRQSLLSHPPQGSPGTCRAAKNEFELVILLHPHPTCRDYSVSSMFNFCGLGIEPRSLRMLTKQSTNCTTFSRQPPKSVGW